MIEFCKVKSFRTTDLRLKASKTIFVFFHFRETYAANKLTITEVKNQIHSFGNILLTMTNAFNDAPNPEIKHTPPENA